MIKDKNKRQYEAFLRNPLIENYNFLPFTVCLYLTRACNLSCPNCTYGANKNFKIGDFLTIEQFQTIIDTTKDYATNFAFGGGEPLLNKNVFLFANMVKEQVSKATVAINTNGLLLTDEKIDRLIESGVDRVQISLDAFDDEGYQRERAGKEGMFNRLCEIIKRLVERKGKSLTPSLSVSFLLHDKNYQDIEKMISLAEDLGVDQVGFHNVNNHMDSEGYQPLFADNKNVTDTLDRVMKRKYQISILLPPLLDHHEFNLCPQLYKDIYINDQLEINPCCHVMDYSYSSLKHNDLEASWKTKKLQTFRKSFIEQRLPHKNCTNCHRRFKFYGTYNPATGWLGNGFFITQLRKIIRRSPGIYRVAFKLRQRLNQYYTSRRKTS